MIRRGVIGMSDETVSVDYSCNLIRSSLHGRLLGHRGSTCSGFAVWIYGSVMPKGYRLSQARTHSSTPILLVEQKSGQAYRNRTAQCNTSKRFMWRQA